MEPNEDPTTCLQNVVATFTASSCNPIDLNRLSMVLPFMEFNSKRFAAGIIRLVRPRTTCLIFSSGNAVCTGAKSEADAKLACMKYVSLLRNAGVSTLFSRFRVQNLVAVANCAFCLDLSSIAEKTDGWISYEPALFPGLMYRKRIDLPIQEEAIVAPPLNRKGHQKRKGKRNRKNTIVFICFQSGRCVITGAKFTHQVQQEWHLFYNTVLLQHRAIADYGSSGNYRRSRNENLKSKSDSWLLQQIAVSAPPTNLTTLSNLPDLDQLRLSQTPETMVVEGLTNFIKGACHHSEVSAGGFNPIISTNTI